VLYAQQDRARGEAVAQMKADGLEYEERMALLENVKHPQPLADLLDAAFESYRAGHPWIEDQRLSPKSVVRDMFERGLTFSEYVSYYGLARSEGLVLRYIADAYRARTHCPKGHPFDADNTGWYRKARYCKTCNRQKVNRLYHLRRAQSTRSTTMSSLKAIDVPPTDA